MNTIPQDVLLKQCPQCGHTYPATTQYFRPKRRVCKKCTYEKRRLKDAQKSKKFHHAKPGATTKMCSNCKIEKPLCCFYKDGRGILKVTSWCSLCKCPLLSKNYVQKPLPFFKICTRCGKEKFIDEFRWEEGRKGNGFTSVCKVCNREKGHIYYAAVRVPKRKKNHNLRSLDGMIRSEDQTRFRARTLGIALIEEVDYVRIYMHDKDRPCYICEKFILPEHAVDFDHVIPLSRSGSHIEENVKLTHAACNRRKYNRLLSEMTPFQRRGV